MRPRPHQLFFRRKAGQKNLIFRTYSEFSCLSLCRANHKTYVLFSLVRKKVPKKYAEGLRALSTPRDAVKLRLRFAPHVLRRYLNFHSMCKRKNAQFFFTSQRLRANTSVLYEIFGFCYNIVFGLPSEFSCLNLWHENEHGFAKDNFVIFSCLSAKIGAAHSRKADGVWGRAP